MQHISPVQAMPQEEQLPPLSTLQEQRKARSVLMRDVSDLKHSSRVMQREEMHEQLSGPYGMFLQLISTAIEVARH